MELKKVILKEHSKNQSIRIVDYVGNSPTRFKLLVDTFLEGPYRITQRAASPLSICVEQNPELVKQHLARILRVLKKSDTPDAVKRNVLRLLQFIEIPKSQKGIVSDVCFKFLEEKKEPIAVRVFAMTVLANLCKELPELKNELIPLIEDQMPYGSAGFVSRGKKVLKELKD